VIRAPKDLLVRLRSVSLAEHSTLVPSDCDLDGLTRALTPDARRGGSAWLDELFRLDAALHIFVSAAMSPPGRGYR
jgi:hypothetical protein